MFSFSKFVVIFFFLCSLYFPINSSTPLCHPNEKLILLQFINSYTKNITGPMNEFCPYPLQIIQSRSSTTGDDCCDWNWVNCDPSNNRVINIDLHCSGLQGSISSINVLFQLDHLQSVILSQNYLTGKIPSSPSNPNGLLELWELNLASNFLYGEVPTWVASFPSLQNLHLDSNRLNGSLVDVLGNASDSLTEIGLSENEFYGSIPLSIFQNLINLTFLDLSRNKLNGTVELIDIFSKFKYLETLDLSDNSLSVIPTTSDKLLSVGSIWPNLSTLGLSSCKLHEFPFLGTVVTLVGLNLSNNDIQGEIPRWIRDMGKSELSYYGSMWIDLSNNSLVGGLEHLPWEKLQSLYISSNLLQGSLPISSINPQFMLFLASNNLLNGTIAKSICNLTSLEALDLSNNSFSGEIPDCLGNTNPSLQILNLGFNSFSGSIPQNFSECDQLLSLDLSDNRLDGAIPRSLVQCTSLQALNLGNNKLKGTFPSWLDTLLYLKVLNLRSNMLHGYVTNTSLRRQSFPSLQILDLSGNDFNGELPETYIKGFTTMMNVTEKPGNPQYLGSSSLGYFSIVLTFKGTDIKYVKIITTMTLIDISNNEFEGEVPSSIGELVSLRGLNLCHNHLTGKIPTTIGNLALLEFLDLSSNRLVGQIPQELVGLTYLGVFNVSENQLTGQIPHGSNFDTFSTNSYKGNPSLCGLPLVECKKDGNSKPGSSNGASNDQDEGYSLPEWEIILVGYVCGTFLSLVWGSYMLLVHGKPIWLAQLANTLASFIGKLFKK